MARANRLPTRVQTAWRQKIQVGKLISRLQQFALHQGPDNPYDMSLAQIKAAQILLGKVVPDLTTISGSVDHAHQLSIRHIEIAPVKAIAHHAAPSIIDADYTSELEPVMPAHVEGRAHV